MSASKRSLDLLVASLALLLLAPAMVVIAVLVRLEDGGPVFFRQARVGWRGKPFHIWKFRTMVVDAERRGPPLTVGRDPRVTRVGARLRRHKLDELPQLFNVLVGEMTLVGPRPEVAKYVALYDEEQRRVLDLVPGITDLASIRYRSESDLLEGTADPERLYVEEVMPDKIRINLEYAARATAWTDLQVVARTAATLLPTARSRRRASDADAIGRPLPSTPAPIAMVPALLLRYRRPVVVAVHLAFVPLGYYAAFALRYDLPLPAEPLRLFWTTLPYVAGLRLVSFALFGLYQGWWRHVSLGDLLSLVKAATLSSGLFLFTLYVLGLLDALSPSILILDWVVSIFLFGGLRFLVRTVREGRMSWRSATPGKRTLMVGAGLAGERLLRQIWRGNGDDILPVGIVDDDPSKRGMRLHGIPVLGPSSDLPWLIVQHQIELIVIAIPSATRQEMQRIVSHCITAGIDFKIVPSMRELLDGQVRLSQLRSVEIEDLLGREPVQLDLAQVERDLRDKVVLITGGAGSIGSELARQIAPIRPARIILVEQAESPLYFVHLELCRLHPETEIVPVIADITDDSRLRNVFAAWRPDYVFHAAAYKHVPLMEDNVVEAVRNNVLGTLRVAQCAADFRARKFVLISTDKAVHPSSVMGATKRVAERIVLGWPSLRASETDFRAVRFGNVLGSDGSVVPLFRRQLGRGGPLTVTHPDVTRYFMTIPEATQLVLQAAALSEAEGRISMLEMGEPVRVVDLAENLIRLSGLEPYRDIPIVFTGLRPGEKLHEELVSTIEASVATSIEKIRLLQPEAIDGAGLVRGIDRLATAVALCETDDLLVSLCALVPDCVSPLREHGIGAARSLYSR